MGSHILLSYEFDGEGGGIPLTGDAISQQLKDDALAWVHLDVNHPDTKEWLRKEISYLDPFIVDSLTAEETRPRITENEGGALIIFRGVNLNEDAAPEDMISIRFWIDSHRIISLQKRQLKSVYDIEAKIKAGKGPKDAGQFISMLASRLIDHMEPVLSELDERVDNAEEMILENADTSIRESIINIRKQAIIFRRYMAPQRDAMGQLRMSDMDWLDNTDKRQIQESYNHIIRYVEDLDAIRERAQIIKDELANILADKLNKNMYVLSVIAAIFLPLGFLTGLLGINVGGIPGGDNVNAFWIFTGMLIVIVLAQITIFKKLKWF
ncbi:zinc transporter ZntB [Kiloniella antarctica]|uniref:Zinc transporter ZntB n=1 Tax=Kiloniella antarctica TaxID=1550907 RepID=A0ABW5BFE9_9PROT